MWSFYARRGARVKGSVHFLFMNLEGLVKAADFIKY